jgi:hypothetical protein
VNHYKGMPTRVKIGNFYFDVKVIDEDTGDAGGFFGSTCPSKQLILIQQGQKPHNLADTFIHEIMHGICWVAEIGQKNGNKDDEEDYVTHLAHGMCQFWQDNPETVEWWARINARVSA